MLLSARDFKKASACGHRKLNKTRFHAIVGGVCDAELAVKVPAKGVKLSAICCVINPSVVIHSFILQFILQFIHSAREGEKESDL